MLDRLTGKPVHLYIHLFSCALLAAGLTSSKIPLSLGTMLGILNLLLEADFRKYGRRLKANRIAWGLWAYIVVQLLSLLWTTDWEYASHDLRVKLPLYVIPLFMVCKPITERRHYLLLTGLFLAALFVTSFINMGSYQHWWGNKVYDDIRGLSLFGSHIRYSLMIVMGIVLCVEWIRQRLPYRLIPVILIGWWLWYANFSQILSGYLALGMVILISLLLTVATLKNRAVKLSLLFTALLVLLGGTWLTVDFMKPLPHRIVMHHLPQYTEKGGWYRHDTVNPGWENGYPIVAFINDEELASAWNAVSPIDYYSGLDGKKQYLSYTLWSYMASKGLRKDSVGFTALTAKDVTYVEKGVASVNLTKGGMESRLYSLKHQLEHPENPNGHSLLQRFQYWKAGSHIIERNWLMGVGAGDVQKAFNEYYTSSKTSLLKELQLRSHNQYMTSWISAGIAGLVTFLFWWIGFFRFSWRNRNYVSICFAIIAMSSFLIEDTIETQMGVTFIAFFYGLLVSVPNLISDPKRRK